MPRRRRDELPNQDVVDSLIAEARADGLVTDSDRPLKRRKRAGESANEVVANPKSPSEEESDEDVVFEDVDLSLPAEEQHLPTEHHADLVISVPASVTKKTAPRKKPPTASEKSAQIDTHKLQIICQLVEGIYINSWCNNGSIQKRLSKLLSAKTKKLLNPRSERSQFERDKDFLDGLKNTLIEFRQRFTILSDNDTSSLSKDAFIQSSESLCGPAGVGNQLLCTLLRGQGIDTRLVISLQPVPLIPKPTPKPDAKEYPTLWCEAWNTARQKWTCVELSLETFNKPSSLRPPTTSPTQLIYIFAFSSDGSARDVTIRYSPSYNGRTRLSRLESIHPSSQLWFFRLIHYFSPFPSPKTQLEDTELTSLTLREGMPTSLEGFKSHPLFALAEHLSPHELIPPTAHEVGTFNTGTSSKPRTIPVYRRSEILTCHTSRDWLRRSGRVIRLGEQPLKSTTNKNIPTGMYTFSQTEPYIAPPLPRGKVPTNAFGNFEVLHPAMLPANAAHVRGRHASRAARLVGVPFAPAVTGFEFVRRKAVPIVEGVVVHEAVGEAVRAVVEGLEELEVEEGWKARSMRALGMWGKMFRGMIVVRRVEGEHGAIGVGVGRVERGVDLGPLGTAGRFTLPELVREGKRKKVRQDCGGKRKRGVESDDEGWIPREGVERRRRVAESSDEGDDSEEERKWEGLFTEDGDVSGNGGGFLPESGGGYMPENAGGFLPEAGGGFLPDNGQGGFLTEHGEGGFLPEDGDGVPPGHEGGGFLPGDAAPLPGNRADKTTDPPKSTDPSTTCSVQELVPQDPSNKCALSKKQDPEADSTPPPVRPPVEKRLPTRPAVPSPPKPTEDQHSDMSSPTRSHDSADDDVDVFSVDFDDD
ncbi:Rad4-domain-containing protein [Piedraia hortae CBS 480.64]|uniref:Rad4-domain-containing protein n=1 Tax=Piedraia hortae CBS 480.64 TaxID=1314780 RepID=A0A6A7BT88_9PEZI|nr:Rad4-domain-containing protein [Piedraia hortae CBS 480.64]